MLQQAAQKLRSAFILGLSLAAVLLAVACGNPATPIQPHPKATSVKAGATGYLSKQVVPSKVNQGSTTLLPRDFQDNSIKFERVSLEDGLSQSSVLCMLQDSTGFMWFGTWDGLNKFDGYTFTVYKHDPEDPYSLSDNAVRSIHEDQSGVLWIGTSEGGLNRFDRETGRFIHYMNDPDDPRSLSDNFVFSIYQDRAGVLWIGTNGGGLNKFDRETESFVRYQHERDDPHSLSSDGVLSIYEDRSGMLWIGTTRGLNKFDRDSEQFTSYQNDPADPNSLSQNTILSIYEDRSGTLWIGTGGGGLDRLDRGSEQFAHYQHHPDDPHSLSDNSIWAIYEDQSGALWIGTDSGGLDVFDREKEQFIHYRNNPRDPYSLSSDQVRSIYGDRSGVLWVGTNGGGANKSDMGRRGFVHYWHDPDNPNSLSPGDVFPIYEDRSGVLWVGTSIGGLNAFDRRSGQFTHYQHDPDDPFSLSSNYALSILEDHTGALWVGTNGGGLNRLDRETGRFTHYQHNSINPNTLSDNAIYVVFEDRSQALWIGTLGGGLNRFDRETERFTRYIHDPNDPHSLSNNHVRAICEDESGMLWIGTNDGLNSLEPNTEQFTQYQNVPDDPNSLGDNHVMSIHQDRNGVLWIGTNGRGLDRFDRESRTFTHYRERDGLSNNVVYGILEDDQGFLWLSTNRGLSRFDPQAETFKNYDVSDGLQSNEFNGGSYHRSSSGEMFFGGINGLTAFYPDHVSDNPHVPPIVLTSLTQGGEEIDLDRSTENLAEVTFHWPNDFFEFEFAALCYSHPEKNQYAYILEGFDQDWNYIGTRRFGRYTNLPGGTYTLRLKGSNNDGVWNEEGISITLTVVPPFWEAWWFRSIAALVLVGSAIGGYRLRVRSIQARNRELEDLVEERTHTLEQRTNELEQRTNETERRRQELEALYRADAELHRHLRLEEVLHALVDIAVDILQADKSALMVWDDQREKLVVQVARGFHPDTLNQMFFAPGEDTVGHVATTGEPVIVEDARTDPRVAKRATIIEPEGIRSFMQVPIKVGGEVFGVFSADYVHPRAFGDDERRLFTALAQRAALAIDTAQLHEQSQELAIVQERNRLARDLHDAVTQMLFSASLIAEALPTLWETDQEEGRRFLNEIRLLSRGALAEMRTLLMELRPIALAEANLGDLLHQLAEAVIGRTGTPVTVKVEGRCMLPTEVHVAFYRIAQEALNNAAKHAYATQVEVSLHNDPLPPHPSSTHQGADQCARVELVIRDDGRGFDPSYTPPDRLGLGIMRERAQTVGAALEIESQPGHGTRIAAIWEPGRLVT